MITSKDKVTFWMVLTRLWNWYEHPEGFTFSCPLFTLTAGTEIKDYYFDCLYSGFEIFIWPLWKEISCYDILTYKFHIRKLNHKACLWDLRRMTT